MGDNKALFVVTATAGQEVVAGDVSQYKATPAAVETELEDKASMTQEQLQNNDFKGQWDLRNQTFSCAQDLFQGELYMVDKVNNLVSGSDLQKAVVTSGMTVTQEVRLAKVNIAMNDKKITISDMDSQLKDMIRMDQVYPREDQLKNLLEDENNKDKMRTLLESMKVRILDATGLLQNTDNKLDTMFCMTIISEPKTTTNYLAFYNDYQNKEKEGDAQDLKMVIQQLFQDDQNNVNVNTNVHDHSYYQILTLCHMDETYLKKWMIYLNREKVDCQVDFNRKNFDIAEDTTTVISSGVSDSTSAELLQQAQARQDEAAALEKKQKDAEEAGKMTKEQQNQKELEKMTAELSDLNESMNEEQQYSQKEITGMMGNIQSMQSSIQNKGEQLQCLQQALQIRQEEENTQVIKLLKDEEMSKVKNVISSAKTQMKEAYKKRIEELKSELNKQKQGIEQEKGSYDQLMVNLIKGGLKKGCKSKCVASRAKVIDSQNKVMDKPLNSFMEEACSDLLQDNQNAADLQGGLLDNINRCTKKELFCGQCCQAQFGTDQLTLRQDCQGDCQVIMDIALADRTVLTADITDILDQGPQKMMKEKVDEEMAIKKTAAASRFKQTLSHVRYHV